MIVTLGATALKMATLENTQKFYLTVKSAAGNVFVATDRQILLSKIAGTSQGLSFANADGKQVIEWIGDLWMNSDTEGTQVNLEFPD
jgi:hypothetical protein